MDLLYQLDDGESSSRNDWMQMLTKCMCFSFTSFDCVIYYIPILINIHLLLITFLLLLKKKKKQHNYEVRLSLSGAITQMVPFNQHNR